MIRDGGIKTVEFSIWWSDRIKFSPQSLRHFMQQMCNRLLVGHCRYGTPNHDKMYLSRAEAELKAYRRTGNQEHLINIANYCWLESVAPQHKNSHYDPEVKSVIR